MKKNFLLLILAAIFFLTGCQKNTSVTITDNLGSTSEFKLNELVDTINNEDKFKKYYYGAEITFEGTIKQIIVNDTHNIQYQKNSGTTSDSIIFEAIDGVTIELGFEKDTKDFSTLNVGDKLKVTSYIMHISSGYTSNKTEVKNIYLGTYVCNNGTCNWNFNNKQSMYENIK